MNRRLTLLLVACAFSGGSASASTPADAVVASARASVESSLGSRYASVDLVTTGRPASGAPEGSTLRALPVAGRFPRERFTVDVQFLHGERIVGHASVGFALHASSEGWVYAKDARSHEAVASVAMERHTVDVAHGIGATPDDLTGMRLRHGVRAGQPVALADFEQVPDVDNREPVRLRAAFGDITVESAGLALRAGNRGDVVTVQVDGATAPVRATVVDRGVAELVR